MGAACVGEEGEKGTRKQKLEKAKTVYRANYL
jgi:hypothetical protein